MALESYLQKEIRRPIEDPARGAEVLFRLICANHPANDGEWSIFRTVARDSKIAQRIRRLREENQFFLARKAHNWIQSGRKPGLAFFKLYNEGVGHSEAILEAMFREKIDTTPYLDTFLLMLLGLKLNWREETNAAIMARDFKTWLRLMKKMVEREDVPAMIHSLKMPLRFYGAWTHTVLGFYDADIRNYFRLMNPNAQFWGDLGGGFATADVNRATGKSWTSLDIQSPDPFVADPELLMLRKLDKDESDREKWPLLTDPERNEYFSRQRQVPWIPWNVLQGPTLSQLIGDQQSYNLISFGFMTSTVRPITDQGAVSGRDWSQDASYRSCLQVMELVASGKDVCLLTIERTILDDRKYRLAFMKWQDRQLQKVLVEARGRFPWTPSEAMDNCARRIT